MKRWAIFSLFSSPQATTSSKLMPASARATISRTSRPSPPEMQRVSITYSLRSGYSARMLSAARRAFSKETDIFSDMSRKITSFPLSSRLRKKS